MMATQTTPIPSLDDDLTTSRLYPVSFAIFAVARSHRAVAASLLSELGLFPGQELMLMQLWDEDGQSQKALGCLQRIDHSTVAKSVRRLEAAGFVTRQKSDLDGRVTLVYLTAHGRELKERTHRVWAELERRTVAGLTAVEQAQFVESARRILPNID